MPDPEAVVCPPQISIELNPVGRFLCQRQDDPAEAVIEVLSRRLVSRFIKAQRRLTLPFRFFFPLILSPISNRQALLKDSCVWTLGSLKNDPLQSSFFFLSPLLIMKSNIHEMDFSLRSLAQYGRICVFAGAFRPCLLSLVRLAWVNGILKAHFWAT